MTIKLQDSDITTAQDSIGDEGVIHVPDINWNHVIKEIEHPDQTFVNSINIDVKDIDIGGSVPQPVNNAMIIKLQDSDITTAQDSADDEGVIHIPDAIWNHIIRETENPGQEWVNSLYIDVRDLEIGGSGLPVIIYSVNIADTFSFNTYDMTLKHSGQSLTVTVPYDKALLYINEYNDKYEICYFFNNTNNNVSRTLAQNRNVRYYLTPNTTTQSNPPCRFYDSNGNEVFYLSDASNNDNTSTFLDYYKSYLDFLWINN